MSAVGGSASTPETSPVLPSVDTRPKDILFNAQKSTLTLPNGIECNVTVLIDGKPADNSKLSTEQIKRIVEAANKAFNSMSTQPKEPHSFTVKLSSNSKVDTVAEFTMNQKIASSSPMQQAANHSGIKRHDELISQINTILVEDSQNSKFIKTKDGEIQTTDSIAEAYDSLPDIKSALIERAHDLEKQFKEISDSPNPDLVKMYEILEKFKEVRDSLFMYSGNLLNIYPLTEDEDLSNLTSIKNDLQKTAEGMEQSLASETEKTKEQLNYKKAKEAMKLFYAIVLDKAETSVKSLEGLDGVVALNEIADVLKAAPKAGNVEDSQRRENAIKSLTYAADIGERLDTITTEKELSSLVDEVVSNVPKPKPGENAQQMIIPGGYKNHATLYQISREPPPNSDKFTLTIINTGAGAEKETAPSGKIFTKDRIFTQLTEQELKTALNKLLLVQTPLGQDQFPDMDMDEVNKIVNEFLVKSDGKGRTNERPGRRHLRQKKGTCAVRCGLSWLYGNIGREAYRQIAPKMIQSSIDNAKEAKAKYMPQNLAQNRLWKYEVFGTFEDSKAQTICNRIFSEAEAVLAKAESRIKATVVKPG